MGTLAQARRAIADHTVSGCGLTHHYTWTHGKELPPCETALRDRRLDCAHTHHPALDEVIKALASEPQVSLDFIKCAREAIGVAHNALWIADLLAIELGDVGLSQRTHRGAFTSDEQRLMKEVGALRHDGSIDGALCEVAIRRAQALGAGLMLTVRNSLLSVIDAIEDGKGAEHVARVLSAGRAHLSRRASDVEKINFPERQCGNTGAALCPASKMETV